MMRIGSKLSCFGIKSRLSVVPARQGIPNILCSSFHRYLGSRIKEIEDVDEAVTVFHQMFRMQPRPTISDYDTLFRKVMDMKNYSQVILLFKRLTLVGYPTVNKFTKRIVIDCYCSLKEADLGYASLSTFHKRGCSVLDTVSIICLIKGFFLEENGAMAVELCKKLITPTSFGINEVVAYLAFQTMLSELNLLNALTVLELGLGENYEISLDYYTKVIDGLCENWMVHEGVNLSAKMIERGIFPMAVTCNTLIHGLCDLGQWDEANKLFRQMVYGLCLQGQLDEAKEVLNLVTENELAPYLVSYGTMYKVYCERKGTNQEWLKLEKMLTK